MGRTVFAIAHGVMRKDKERGQLHERGQANCWSRVVAEYEEGRAKRPQLGQGHSVDGRGHGVLADSIVQVLSPIVVRLEISSTGISQSRFVRWAEISRTTQEPGNILRQHVQRFA